MKSYLVWPMNKSKYVYKFQQNKKTNFGNKDVVNRSNWKKFMFLNGITILLFQFGQIVT